MESTSATTVVKLSSDLIPGLGMRLTDNGVVRHRDVTRYGLHRMRVERVGGYPSVQAWCAWIRQIGGGVMAHYFEEKAGREFIGILWLFWK